MKANARRFVKNKKEFNLSVRTTLDGIHSPRGIKWNNVFSGVKNYSQLHPLKTWTLYGIKNTNPYNNSSYQSSYQYYDNAEFEEFFREAFRQAQQQQYHQPLGFWLQAQAGQLLFPPARML